MATVAEHARLPRPARVGTVLLLGVLAGPCGMAPPPPPLRAPAAELALAHRTERATRFLADRAVARYAIRANDTLSRIAAWYHVDPEVLARANPELAKRPREVAIGERVVVPLGGG